MSEMLKIENIRKVFNPGTINEKVALDGVNLTLEEGEFVTVIGGNGAGKSTTLNAVAGVWPVDSGKIYIGGEDVTKLSEHRRAQYLGRVFQDPMTVRLPQCPLRKIWQLQQDVENPGDCDGELPKRNARNTAKCFPPCILDWKIA